MTLLKHRNQHSQHPKKHKKPQETTERNRVDKQKIPKKEEREDVHIKKLIAASCEEL